MVRYKNRKRKLQGDVVQSVQVSLPSAAGHPGNQFTLDLCRSVRETVRRYLDVHYKSATEFSVPFRNLREMKVVSHIVAQRFGEEIDDVYQRFSWQWGNRRRRHRIRSSERGRPKGQSPAEPCYEQWLQEEQLRQQRIADNHRRMQLEEQRWKAAIALRRKQEEQRKQAEAKEKQLAAQLFAVMKQLRFAGAERLLIVRQKCSPELLKACTEHLAGYEQECWLRLDISALSHSRAERKVRTLVSIRKSDLERGSLLFTWMCTQLNEELRGFLHGRRLLSICGDAVEDNMWSAAFALDEFMDHLGLQW